MKKILSIILFLALASNIFAAPVINEIYPAPESGEFEWVELYNDDSLPLYIYNYALSDLAGNKIKLATDTIGAFSFAVSTSSSILNNSGDTVFLKNALNEIINVATYSGTFYSSQSFARCPDGGNYWLTTDAVTENSSNLAACFSLTPTPTLAPLPTLTPTVNPTPLPTPASYDNILLSEVMVNPAPGEPEWVEFYNDNDFSISLTNWYLDDLENGGSSPKKFSLDIPAKSYKAYNLGSSVFNNDEDSVRLLDFNKILKDDFEYYMSVAAQTYGRAVGDDDFCLEEPSYEAVNNSCLTPLVLVESKPTLTAIPTKFPLPTKPSSTTVKPINYQVKAEGGSGSSVEVLGVADEKTLPIFYPTRLLSFLSLSYSLLTMSAILFKMKFKYGARKKILLSLFHPGGGE